MVFEKDTENNKNNGDASDGDGVDAPPKDAGVDEFPSKNSTTAVADENLENEDNLQDGSVTMVDVLKEQEEMEEHYVAVLGASDDKACTYNQGSIKRQALYSCLTCCPEARNNLDKCAGVCLACSLRCHDKHELVELYTKRNFRCDCPTTILGGNKCLLNDSFYDVQPRNVDNLYNHNFQGLYCSCHRPFPDPMRMTGEEMIQCSICEDWFHFEHLGSSSANVEKLVDLSVEMICGKCMQLHSFLKDYVGLALTVPTEESAVEENEKKLASELDKSITQIMGFSAADAVDATKSEESEKPTTSKESPDDTPAKRRRLNPVDPSTPDGQSCVRPVVKVPYDEGAVFWGSDFRSSLCTCPTCMALYKAEKVSFLTDLEDSAKSYEERGRISAGPDSSYEKGMKALATLEHVKQIEAIQEYNKMKNKLKDFLQDFAETNKVVTEADVNRFFSQIRNKKNETVGQPHFCR